MAIAFKNSGLAITTTSTAVYTCPANTESVIIGADIANVHASNTGTVTVEVYDDSAATTKKITEMLPISIASGFSLPSKIVLEANDELRMSADANLTLEAQISVMEKS